MTLPLMLKNKKSKSVNKPEMEVVCLRLENRDLDQLRYIALFFKLANHVLGGENRMFSTLVKNAKREYATVCRHTHYNIFHEQYERLTGRLRQLQRMAEGENNVLHRMIFIFSEKLEAVEEMHREIDKIIENKEPKERNVIKLGAWLQRHLTISYSKHMQNVNQLPEYKHQLELVVDEIDRVKHLPRVKPIEILKSNFEIEMYEKQVPTMIKEKQKRIKDNDRTKIESKNAAFDEHAIVADCLKKFYKLKRKLQDVDGKVKNKSDRFAAMMKNIQRLEYLKMKQNQSVGSKDVGFCDIIAAKQQLAQNNETIRCLKKKLKKMNAKKALNNSTKS